ncbi:CoA transferase, partial [Bordetella hinzii]|nr:CoA transferase [Bordetella hinzii]
NPPLLPPFVTVVARARALPPPGGVVARAPAGGRAPPHPTNPAPPMGADTDELLRELGYDAEDIVQLRERSVI